MDNNFSTNLKFLRLQKKLFQQDIANKIGVDRSTIGYWEKGKADPTMINVIKLSEILNISVPDLISKNLIAEEDLPQKAIELNGGITVVLNKDVELSPDDAVEKVNNYNNFISSNLHVLRKINNIKQSEMAKILNVDQSTIAKWENGNREPNIEWILKICSYFNVFIADFIIKDLRLKDSVSKVVNFENGIQIVLYNNSTLSP